jgi:hypothetical protein
MKKITKKAQQEFIKDKLANNAAWATKALLSIYKFQTDQEQRYESTIDANGVGFSGCDGEILSSFAKFYQKTGFLTPKQMVYVYKKMPKYWNQIVSISDTAKLNQMIINANS